ncbi:hypothetical protein [Blastococcus sp. CT_GayMR16]|uniref:hypothetical protein n=1 Tax=Blastococcus sp. CT_GayMR16 TaxID=2559607 RepID=UPI00107479D6|nr:hypothetical protein [Blastococcus sp. CT_GayMR16]TFV83364.1 hypothetical protein E4P38_20280 [Blastococcus sp. CT_GayMR16]
MSGVGGLSSSEVLVGGKVGQGWWLVVDEADGPGRIVAGPFPDRGEARWAATLGPEGTRPVYGVRRTDGGLTRKPSPQDWAWLAHLGEQLERLPDDWATVLSDDDPLTTLVVEVTAALAEAGLPLHDSAGPSDEVGGACLIPEPVLGGIVVTWRQHDRMSVDRVHGLAPAALVQQVMNRAVADVLAARGFLVDAFGGASGHVVRPAA